MHRPVSELAAGLQEAVAARILIGSGAELAFRHQLISQALYESMPAALRTALHAEAAHELAATGADALSVAQQLSASGRPGEGWARDWLLQAGPELITQAPRLAAELLRRELDVTPGGDGTRDALMASLVRALLAAGAYDEAAQQAAAALPVMTEPELRLAHPGQAGRQEPGGDRPRGAASGHHRVAAPRNGKVSSDDDYLSRGRRSFLERVTRKPGTAR